VAINTNDINTTERTIVGGYVDINDLSTLIKIKLIQRHIILDWCKGRVFLLFGSGVFEVVFYRVLH
jgi:hypothetical protein